MDCSRDRRLLLVGTTNASEHQHSNAFNPNILQNFPNITSDVLQADRVMVARAQTTVAGNEGAARPGVTTLKKLRSLLQSLKFTANMPRVGTNDAFLFDKGAEAFAHEERFFQSRV